MNLFPWRRSPVTEDLKEIQAEKRELKAELALSVMRFERRRSTVTEIAEDVMKVMHQKGGGN